MATVDDLNQALPQTQCGECGFNGCQPYAQALAEGQASIDRCPPGGVKVLGRLAALLRQDPKPYAAAVAAKTREPSIAMIDEDQCIGCTKCVQACPVDAIVGASKKMHTVIDDECTGCGLCVAPCPVDCIMMLPQAEASFDKVRAQRRFESRQQRLARLQQRKRAAYQAHAALAPTDKDDRAAKRAYILQSLQRKSQLQDSHE